MKKTKENGAVRKRELVAGYGQFRLYKAGAFYQIVDEATGAVMEMPLDAICLLQRLLAEEFGHPE